MSKKLYKIGWLFFCILIAYLIHTTFSDAADVSRAEYSGILFKTRYQNIRIDTPILVEMENKSRVLKFTLKNLENAKVSFLAKITPGDLRVWQNSIQNNAKDLPLLSSKKAYFVFGKKRIKIGEITVNIDGKSLNWIEKHEYLFKRAFNDCRATVSLEGFPDIVCRPFIIKAKITKIERSTLNPTLPEELDFPNIDYIDIYIEIIDII